MKPTKISPMRMKMLMKMVPAVMISPAMMMMMPPTIMMLRMGVNLPVMMVVIARCSSLYLFKNSSL